MNNNILKIYWNEFLALKLSPAYKAIIVFIGYIILTKIIDLIIDYSLKRIATFTKSDIDDEIVRLLHRPICLTVIFLGLINSIIIWGPASPWNFILPDIIKSVLLMIWLVAVLKIVGIFSEQGLASILHQGRAGRDLFYLLKNVIRVVVIVLAALWLLSIWKVNLTPLFASAGIAGIAVALAAKDSLANFFGGISIFFDQAYKIGDFIILDSGERGEVVDIGIRSTRIKTRDDVLITIPNSIMANSRIINESAPIPRFRIRVPIGVAYGTDLKMVEALLLDVAHKNARVVSEPAARVRLRQFADSSINFELLCWVSDPSEKGIALHELLNDIYDIFDRNSIAIPFPQRDVHLFSEGAGSSNS